MLARSLCRGAAVVAAAGRPAFAAVPLSCGSISAGSGIAAVARTAWPRCLSSTPASASAEASDSSSASTAQPSAARQASISMQRLAPAPGSSVPARRKGRGHGSGMGKYATRGMKGAKSRAGGGVKPTFEGGQTPIHRRTPKMGYMPAMLDTPMEPVNLDKLQQWIDAGRIDASKPITMRTLVESGLLTSIKHGVKLLGQGAGPSGVFAARGLQIEVTQASASAIAAVEAAGGSVRTVFYSPMALRALLRPADAFDLPVKSPLPHTKAAIYYMKAENRGYLNPEVQLQTIKARLAAGEPLERAVQVLPVYVGGPVEVAVRSGIAPVSSATPKETTA